MSGLSETFLIVAGFSALFTALVFCLFMILRHSLLWAGIATLMAAGFVIWVLLALGGGPLRLGQAGWIALFVAVGAVLFALLWAGFVRFRVWKHGLLVTIIALALPALMAIGLAFERQRLPNAACANQSIPLQLGEVDLRISPYFMADLKFAAPSQDSARYSIRPRDKEDRRRLCDLTEGGTTPIDVALIWMSPGAYSISLEQRCSTDMPPFYCEAERPDGFRNLGSLQLMIRDETSLRYEMSFAGTPVSSGLHFDGDDRVGEMCLGDDETSEGFVCRVWRELDDETVVLATGRSSGLGSHEYYLLSLKNGMDFMLAAMAR